MIKIILYNVAICYLPRRTHYVFLMEEGLQQWPKWSIYNIGDLKEKNLSHDSLLLLSGMYKVSTFQAQWTQTFSNRKPSQTSQIWENLEVLLIAMYQLYYSLQCTNCSAKTMGIIKKVSKNTIITLATKATVFPADWLTLGRRLREADSGSGTSLDCSATQPGQSTRDQVSKTICPLDERQWKPAHTQHSHASPEGWDKFCLQQSPYNHRKEHHWWEHWLCRSTRKWTPR